MKKLILCILLSGLFGSNTFSFGASGDIGPINTRSGMIGAASAIAAIFAVKAVKKGYHSSTASEAVFNILKPDFSRYGYGLPILLILLNKHIDSNVTRPRVTNVALSIVLIEASYYLLGSCGRLLRMACSVFSPAYDQNLKFRDAIERCDLRGPEGELVIPSGVVSIAQPGSFTIVAPGASFFPIYGSNMLVGTGPLRFDATVERSIVGGTDLGDVDEDGIVNIPVDRQVKLQNLGSVTNIRPLLRAAGGPLFEQLGYVKRSEVIDHESKDVDEENG
ncbi:hypothetical protein HN446_03210 [bacterium]|nr:hypothetical protein [bacterium]